MRLVKTFYTCDHSILSLFNRIKTMFTNADVYENEFDMFKEFDVSLNHAWATSNLKNFYVLCDYTLDNLFKITKFDAFIAIEFSTQELYEQYIQIVIADYQKSKKLVS